MARPASHLHRRKCRRRQEHADRAAALRFASGLRGPDPLGRAASKNRTAGPIDFSLFTDGLRAEREQGITIDVAYRYFATARRKFILADTPGHEQYTRNMATGASTADVAILLVDARHGVLDQTRRHARIARLLGIIDFVLAVNKMDLVDFDRGVFDGICDDSPRSWPAPRSTPFRQRAPRRQRDHAQRADAVVRRPEPARVPRDRRDRSRRRPATLAVSGPARASGPTRTSAATPGRSLSGTIRVGDHDHGLAVRAQSRVKRIVTFDGDLDVAFAPMSVTLVLEDELDVSRGDLLASGHDRLGRRFKADVVWMDERPLEPSRTYLLKHSSRTVTAQVDTALALNDIGTVTALDVARAHVRRLHENRTTGSFILIEPATNFTAGAGMIVRAVRDEASVVPGMDAADRLARAARDADSHSEAIEAVRRVLEEILT